MLSTVRLERSNWGWLCSVFLWRQPFQQALSLNSTFSPALFISSGLPICMGAPNKVSATFSTTWPRFLKERLYPSKVRKARNRRQEWNVLAYDKEFRPDARLTPSPYHGVSSEGSLSPDSRFALTHILTRFNKHTKHVGPWLGLGLCSSLYFFLETYKYCWAAISSM